MLFTFVLLGFVNSSCLTRTFEECLSLNVEYQESCQLSQGECRPRPLKCTEIDSTYPQNCKTSECYYSKRFNKCLSQPFTRLLNEIANRGGQHHQGGSTQGPHQSGPQSPSQGPVRPPQQPPQQPSQQPPSMPPQQPSTEITQEQSSQNNDSPIELSEEENDSEENSTDDYDDDEQQYTSQNNFTNPINTTNPINPMNSTNSTIKSNSTVSTEFNDTYPGFQYLIEEEIKARLNTSDDRKQLEIRSSEGLQLMIALILMIILI